MRCWYRDKDIAIFFDIIPQISMRLILPSMSDAKKEQIREKPFLNKKTFCVVIFDYRKKIKYTFRIIKGYTWDGASIPKLFHNIIGSNTNPEFMIMSCVHDKLCEKRHLINYDRKLSSLVLKGLALSAGVSKAKAEIMYLSVDMFQRFQGWGNGKILKQRKHNYCGCGNYDLDSN